MKLNLPEVLKRTFLLLAAVSLLASPTALHAADVKVGDDAPDFELTGLNNSKVKLSSYETKKNVVVIFSRAHWCPFCMGQLKQFADKYPTIAKTNTEVITVFREEREGQGGLERSKKASGAEFPLALDLSSAKTPTYSSTGYTTYVIDKKGKVQAVLTGTKKNRPKPAAVLKSLQSLK